MIMISTYLLFLSCTSLNVLRTDEETADYKPAPGDSVLIETRRGNFYKSVIIDTSSTYITTRNHQIDKSYITSITPRKDSDDVLIILITGTVAIAFLYSMGQFLNQ